MPVAVVVVVFSMVMVVIFVMIPILMIGVQISVMFTVGRFDVNVGNVIPRMTVPDGRAEKRR